MLIHSLPCPMTDKSTKPSPLPISSQRQALLCVRISEPSLVMLALTFPTRSCDNVKYIGPELSGDSVCLVRLRVRTRTSQDFSVTQNLYVIE
jgi:hypothetical protein